jgi:hypothetical protein
MNEGEIVKGFEERWAINLKWLQENNRLNYPGEKLTMPEMQEN